MDGETKGCVIIIGMVLAVYVIFALIDAIYN